MVKPSTQGCFIFFIISQEDPEKTHKSAIFIFKIWFGCPSGIDTLLELYQTFSVRPCLI